MDVVLSFFCTASDNVSSSLVVDRLTPRPKVPETMVGATGAGAKVKELGKELDFRLKSISLPIIDHSLIQSTFTAPLQDIYSEALAAQP